MIQQDWKRIIIKITSIQMEFLPFDFLSIYAQPAQQKTSELLSQINTEEPLSQMDMEDYKIIEQSSTQIPNATLSKKSNASEYHNMTKQTVITMKQIMSPFIQDIGSSLNKRKIIKNVWEKMTKKKHPTKSIFRLAFDPQADPQLLEQEELIESTLNFNDSQFKQAMQELKDELIMRMKESNIRSNLIDRDIAKKDVLLAYIQHFIHDELKGGEIKARFGPSGSKKIKKIVNKTRREQDLISDFFLF